MYMCEWKAGVCTYRREIYFRTVHFFGQLRQRRFFPLGENEATHTSLFSIFRSTNYAYNPLTAKTKSGKLAGFTVVFGTRENGGFRLLLFTSSLSALISKQSQPVKP